MIAHSVAETVKIDRMSLNVYMPYQLRRLRLRGLIERIPQSLRCRVTDFGPRIALLFHPNNRLLRPDRLTSPARL